MNLWIFRNLNKRGKHCSNLQRTSNQMRVCVCVSDSGGVRHRGSWGGEGQGKCLGEYINSHSLPKKCKVPQGSREERGYVWLRKFRAAFWSNICLLPTSLLIITPMTFLHNVFFFGGSDQQLISAFPFPDHSTHPAILPPSALSRSSLSFTSYSPQNL